MKPFLKSIPQVCPVSRSSSLHVCKLYSNPILIRFRSSLILVHHLVPTIHVLRTAGCIYYLLSCSTSWHERCNWKIFWGLQWDIAFCCCKRRGIKHQVLGIQPTTPKQFKRANCCTLKECFLVQCIFWKWTLATTLNLLHPNHSSFCLAQSKLLLWISWWTEKVGFTGKRGRQPIKRWCESESMISGRSCTWLHVVQAEPNHLPWWVRWTESAFEPSVRSRLTHKNILRLN